MVRQRLAAEVRLDVGRDEDHAQHLRLRRRSGKRYAAFERRGMPLLKGTFGWERAEESWNPAIYGHLRRIQAPVCLHLHYEAKVLPPTGPYVFARNR